MVSQLIETYGREVVSRPMQRINRIDTLGSTDYIHFKHYNTRCYFSVQSKTGTNQLNLPHGTNNQKVENEKPKKTKTKTKVGENYCWISARR